MRNGTAEGANFVVVSSHPRGVAGHKSMRRRPGSLSKCHPTTFQETMTTRFMAGVTSSAAITLSSGNKTKKRKRKRRRIRTGGIGSDRWQSLRHCLPPRPSLGRTLLRRLFIRNFLFCCCRKMNGPFTRAIFHLEKRKNASDLWRRNHRHYLVAFLFYLAGRATGFARLMK